MPEHVSRATPSLFKRLMTPPASVSARDRRGYHASIIGALAGLSIHLVMTVLFGLLDVRPMFYLNLVSNLVWLVCLGLLLTTGSILTAVIVSTVELVVHQSFAIFFLGWGFGFQSYLFIIALYVSLVLIDRVRTRLVIVGLCAAAYLFNFVYVRHLAAPLALDERIADAFHIVNVVGVVTCIALLAFAYSAAVLRAEEALAREHEKSVRLLHNILPVAIADRLRDDDQTIADGHGMVTVLFSDLVGFTRMSEKISPAELVAILNDIFSRFDALSERYGLEKIKTIGDAYMVAAGVPLERPDHAAAVADFALGMLDEIAAFNRERGQELEMRIGIHSGPVVAGVIGRRKFAYDLWGDTVNTAARMESHGVAGRIHVSAATRTLLEDRYRFEDRGEIDIKGKGPLRTSFLLDRREVSSAPRLADHEVLERAEAVDRDLDHVTG